MSQRYFDNWLDGFKEYTADIPAPDIFKKWGAISTIAAALERRVWYDSVYKIPLYPNLFTFFLATPGVGKGIILKQVISLWKELSNKTEDQGDSKSFHMAPTNATSASLIDDLQKAKRVVYTDVGEAYRYNALTIGSEELGAFMPGYDVPMMNNLTTLYDAGVYEESRRSREKTLRVLRPVINILAGATPGYISESLPEGAWDQGFLSRTLLIYSSEIIPVNLLKPIKNTDELRKHLCNDLKQIFSLFGAIVPTRAALELNQEWIWNGLAPAPTHPKLQYYNSRRNAHMTKLAMILVVAEGDRLVIEPRHISAAISELTLLETAAAGLFQNLSSSSDQKVMDECWHYVDDISKKINGPVPKEIVFRWIAKHVPVYNVDRMIKVMVGTGLLIEKFIPKLGTAYVAHIRRMK